MTSREIVLIAAVGPGMLIGEDNRLPWKLPRDMRLFRRLTTGYPIILGRKTFESFGRRPLPKRRNIVVTHKTDYIAPGCEVAHSLEEAIAKTPADGRIYVIGGGSIYSQCMPFATSIVLTEIFDENPNVNLFELFRGDVRFPNIDPAMWSEVSAAKRSFVAATSVFSLHGQKRKGLRFRVRRFVRAGVAVPPSAKLGRREVSASLAVPRPTKAKREAATQPSLFPVDELPGKETR